MFQTYTPSELAKNTIPIPENKLPTALNNVKVASLVKKVLLE